MEPSSCVRSVPVYIPFLSMHSKNPSHHLNFRLETRVPKSRSLAKPSGDVDTFGEDNREAGLQMPISV